MFCYKCKHFIPDAKIIPQFNLPVSLIVYKNIQEKDQKSTAWPLQFLSKDIKVEGIYKNVEKRLKECKYPVILYPGENAVKSDSNYIERYR